MQPGNTVVLARMATEAAAGAILLTAATMQHTAGPLLADLTCVKLAPVRIQHLLSTVNSPNSVFST